MTEGHCVYYRLEGFLSPHVNKWRRKLELTCFPAQSLAATPCWSADEASRCRQTLWYSRTAGNQSTSVNTQRQLLKIFREKKLPSKRVERVTDWFTHVIYPYVRQQCLVDFFLQMNKWHIRRGWTLILPSSDFWDLGLSNYYLFVFYFIVFYSVVLQILIYSFGSLDEFLDLNLTIWN